MAKRAEQVKSESRRGADIVDPEALASIYDEYHPLIYRYIYRQVGDSEAALDLAADVFRNLLATTRAGRGTPQHLSAWLYRVAHNAVIDYYRRQKLRHHLPLEDDLPAEGSDPAHSAESNLAAAQVRAALSALSPDQRQVILLKFFEGCSNEEVAQVLAKPVGAVKSLQHRALAALHRALTAGRGRGSL